VYTNKKIFAKKALRAKFMKKKALFIDRDGVINDMVRQKNGLFDSPQTEFEVSLTKGIVEIISFCNYNNIPVIEISNQPGIAKNKLTLETLNAIETKIHTLLQAQGVVVDDIYLCLHHPDAKNKEYKINCDCRKPKPGMFHQAEKDHTLDLSQSIFLGDNVTDMEAGKAAGCTTILFFHENDLKEKVNLAREYSSVKKITSLEEFLPILKTLL
jgi:D-glycero-D-manno-heptose 1,7-bisphosphate phosphatase